MLTVQQLVGGPTAVLEYGGLRWLTDRLAVPERGGTVTV